MKDKARTFALSVINLFLIGLVFYYLEYFPYNIILMLMLSLFATVFVYSLE